MQARCETFNGQEVRNLARLAELVDSCQDKYMRFGLEGGKLVILDRCACSGASHARGLFLLGVLSLWSWDASPDWVGSEGRLGPAGDVCLHWRVILIWRGCHVCRLQAMEDAPRILQQHAITFDRSTDLR